MAQDSGLTAGCTHGQWPVSYTHLDVYKRQLHVADGDDVALVVAHDLVLDLFPARNALFHQDLMLSLIHIFSPVKFSAQRRSTSELLRTL